MSPLESTRESALALVACVVDPRERRRILSELIRQRAVAISFELLIDAEAVAVKEVSE